MAGGPRSIKHSLERPRGARPAQRRMLRGVQRAGRGARRPSCSSDPPARSAGARRRDARPQHLPRRSPIHPRIGTRARRLKRRARVPQCPRASTRRPRRVPDAPPDAPTIQPRFRDARSSVGVLMLLLLLQSRPDGARTYTVGSAGFVSSKHLLGGTVVVAGVRVGRGTLARRQRRLLR
jgi:hypothetical protein